jgi:hypothetical protein
MIVTHPNSFSFILSDVVVAAIAIAFEASIKQANREHNNNVNIHVCSN